MSRADGGGAPGTLTQQGARCRGPDAETHGEAKEARRGGCHHKEARRPPHLQSDRELTKLWPRSGFVSSNPQASLV